MPDNSFLILEYSFEYKNSSKSIHATQSDVFLIIGKYLLYTSCCLITMFKNERHIINEWLDHHISVGFDHIYLIDNMSSDNYIIDDKFKKFVTIYKSEIRQQDVFHPYVTDGRRCIGHH